MTIFSLAISLISLSYTLCSSQSDRSNIIEAIPQQKSVNPHTISHNSASEDNIYSAELGFSERWRDFEGEEKDFPLWTPNWKTDDLKQRFDEMLQDRWFVYFTNPEDYGKKGTFGKWNQSYQMPNIKTWHSRYPFSTAFMYNLANADYSASIIVIDGINFLAMEAPCQKNLHTFFHILNEYNVTNLIRLTPAYYKNRTSCFPYWDGRTKTHTHSERLVLEVAQRKINYFPVNDWNDHEGISTESLLKLIQDVKESYRKDSQMIGVHCRAGVSRTGAFIAAYALVNEIDLQLENGVEIEDLEISIDKVIWKVSLQRPFGVSHFSQYITLHKLVSLYTNKFRDAKALSVINNNEQKIED